MIQAFYKTNPTQDTPYRQLSLNCENGWRVRLTGGTKWGREHAEELKVVPVQSFDEAKGLYDKLFWNYKRRVGKPTAHTSLGNSPGARSTYWTEMNGNEHKVYWDVQRSFSIRWKV